VAGERILVVEDNATNVKLFRDVLQAQGSRTIARILVVDDVPEYRRPRCPSGG
jgi:hypothetical protein